MWDRTELCCTGMNHLLNSARVEVEIYEQVLAPVGGGTTSAARGLVTEPVSGSVCNKQGDAWLKS
ncbi:MAG TPA: hypothetical protein VFD58_13915 [Blastocatellia bacterium]|nr:hypothetical protein [Blastocatellia bacterium]